MLGRGNGGWTGIGVSGSGYNEVKLLFQVKKAIINQSDFVAEDCTHSLQLLVWERGKKLEVATLGQESFLCWPHFHFSVLSSSGLVFGLLYQHTVSPPSTTGMHTILFVCLFVCIAATLLTSPSC